MIENKYKNLTLGIVLDAIGYLSFIFPLFDIVWAPLSAYLMTTMYKGRKGKIAAAITFIEEAMPFLDIIPTFTIMWFYTYVIDKKKSETVVDA
jgi:hypothetical protein